MLNPPPFKLATHHGSTSFANGDAHRPACCEDATPDSEEAAEDQHDAMSKPGRMKLSELDTHFQCSVIGTCLSTSALRKVMSKFIHILGVSDHDIHHEAVWMASKPGPASKALHKALDHHHAATLARFARVTHAHGLEPLWDEALRSGDIPGAYWAVLTHRQTTTTLRKKVFGDVHMLSHLVGAANRADIRRLVALEQANSELRGRIDSQHDSHAAQEETIRQLRADLEAMREALRAARMSVQLQDGAPAHAEKVRVAAEQVALQTQRREVAEQMAAAAEGIASRLVEEVSHLRKHAAVLRAELQAAEAQFREATGPGPHQDGPTALPSLLQGRRILYVGGRPSSTPSIRALVERYGGVFRHHDGGLEDRKGLLTASVLWAELVVFPVDCVDHDSVGVLKQLCSRHAIDFLALRSAGIGSFAAALSREGERHQGGPNSPDDRPCRRHG
jgi:hypothetical protein